MPELVRIDRLPDLLDSSCESIEEATRVLQQLFETGVAEGCGLRIRVTSRPFYVEVTRLQR